MEERRVMTDRTIRMLPRMCADGGVMEVAAVEDTDFWLSSVRLRRLGKEIKSPAFYQHVCLYTIFVHPASRLTWVLP